MNNSLFANGVTTALGILMYARIVLGTERGWETPTSYLVRVTDYIRRTRVTVRVK